MNSTPHIKAEGTVAPTTSTLQEAPKIVRWTGGPISPNVVCVLANNPTSLTYDGTNAYVVRAEGCTDALVIDPGFDNQEHTDAIMAQCREWNVRPAYVLVTHQHGDHLEGIFRLQEACLAEYGKAASVYLPVAHAYECYAEQSGRIVDADVVVTPGPLPLGENAPRVEVVPLPGHSSDQVGYLLPDEKLICTGDAIFKSWSTVIVHPDGSVRAFLESLDRLEALYREGRFERMLPGHGWPIDDPLDAIERYRAHRLGRIEKLKSSIASVGFDEDALMEALYAGIPETLKQPARISLQAQLAYLEEMED